MRLSSQTVQDFALRIAKRFLTKNRKIISKAVLKWLQLNFDKRFINTAADARPKVLEYWI